MNAEYQALHTDADREKNQMHIKRWLVAFSIFALLGAALIVVSFIIRDATHMNNQNENLSQALTIAVTLVWGALLIFVWGMKLSPHLHYRRFLREVYSGLSRDVKGRVVRVEEETTFREGLMFYRLIVNVGDLKNPEDERLLYFDARLEKPKPRVGATMAARVHGNDIISFREEQDTGGLDDGFLE